MNAWPDTFHEGDRDSSPGTRPPKFTINVFRSISDKMPVRSRLVSSVQLATLMRKTHQVPRKDDAALLTLVTYRPGATSRGTADIESARCVYVSALAQIRFFLTVRERFFPPMLSPGVLAS